VTPIEQVRLTNAGLNAASHNGTGVPGSVGQRMYSSDRFVDVFQMEDEADQWAVRLEAPRASLISPNLH
jgi:hypothetical protein